MSDTFALSAGIVLIITALIVTTVVLAFVGPNKETVPPFLDGSDPAETPAPPGKLVIGPPNDVTPPPSYPNGPEESVPKCEQSYNDNCHTVNMQHCFGSWIDDIFTSTPAPISATFIDNRDMATDSPGNTPQIGDTFLYQDVNGVSSNFPRIIRNAFFWIECDRAGRPPDFLAKYWPLVTFSKPLTGPPAFAILRLYYLPKDKTLGYWDEVTRVSKSVQMSYLATVDDLTNYTNYFSTIDPGLCDSPPPLSSLAFDSTGSVALAGILLGLFAVLVVLCYLVYLYRNSRKFVLD